MPANASISSTPPREDAITLLTADHKAVKQLFTKFDALKKSAASEQEKADLVETICNELTIHAQIEEEIFYPAVRLAIDDDDLMDEADVEHDEVKELIAQLQGTDAGGDHYDAKVTVLGENVEHHVKEEESEMFPKVRKAKVDTAALGMKMAARKAELETELGKQQEPRRTKSGNNGDHPSSRSGRATGSAAKR